MYVLLLSFSSGAQVHDLVPQHKKAVVMETAQDANLTTSDIQTNRDTISFPLPHQFDRGQICYIPSSLEIECMILWGNMDALGRVCPSRIPSGKLQLTIDSK